MQSTSEKVHQYSRRYLATKKWRDANPDKVYEQRKRFIEKRRALLMKPCSENPTARLSREDRHKLAQAKHYQAHKDKIIAASRAWQAANAEKVKAYRREYWRRIAERVKCARAEARRIEAEILAKAQAKMAKKLAAEEAKKAKRAKIVTLAKAWQDEQDRKVREARIRIEAAKPENWHRAIGF